MVLRTDLTEHVGGLEETRLAAVATAPGQPLLTAATRDGRVLAVPVEWEIEFVGEQRVVEPAPGEPVVFALDPEGNGVGAFAVRLDAAGNGMAAGLLADGTLDTNALISHRLDHTEAPDAFHMLLRDRSEAMGVVINWDSAS